MTTSTGWVTVPAAAVAVVTGCAAPATTGGPGGVAAVPPGVTLTLEEETYPVVGRTFDEVGRSLRAMSPRMAGRSARGVHSSRIGWSFSYGMVEGRCRTRNLEVVVTSTILLPRWNGPAGASPGLEEAWATYVAAVRDHEEHHRALALEAAAEIRRGVEGLEAPTCSEAFAEGADDIGHAILAAYEERNRAFDGTAPRVGWPPGGIPPMESDGGGARRWRDR